MLIPKYWAQYKQRFDSKTEFNNAKKQATIKRYGWSDISQTDALNHAKARVTDAHNRWLAGEDILRRERREEYNEGNGIPIREQIISERTFLESDVSNKSAAATQLIVTRNSYGAQVANVDNIVIIDVDNDDLLHQKYPDDYDKQGFMGLSMTDKRQPSSIKIKVWSFVFIFILIASVISWLGLSWLWLLVVMVGVTVYLWQQASKRDKMRAQKYADDAASLLPFITELIKQRVASYPQESFRLYETPAGFRIIVTHNVVEPSNKVVEEWFDYFHADTNYVRLCQAQQCFRARLTAKPWRMNEVNDNHLAKDIPAKNFWFDESSGIDNQKAQTQKELVARQQWIADYDKYAKSYRACRYIESFSGDDINSRSDKPTQAIDAFIQWHDKACQADTDLPMA